MDIARPEIKRQKRRRQILWSVAALVVLVGVTVGISRLKPAAPTVDRSTIWTDTVKRGSMLRQVRGLGSLIPSHEDVRQIPAETEATVIRIDKLPGSQVEARHRAGGDEQSATGAGSARRPAAGEGRGSRIPESEGQAGQRPDDAEGGRRHRECRLQRSRSARRRPTSRFTTWASSPAWRRKRRKAKRRRWSRATTLKTSG